MIKIVTEPSERRITISASAEVLICSSQYWCFPGKIWNKRNTRNTLFGFHSLFQIPLKDLEQNFYFRKLNQTNKTLIFQEVTTHSSVLLPYSDSTEIFPPNLSNLIFFKNISMDTIKCVHKVKFPIVWLSSSFCWNSSLAQLFFWMSMLDYVKYDENLKVLKVLTCQLEFVTWKLFVNTQHPLHYLSLEFLFH